jgi:hypothetical protein
VVESPYSNALEEVTVAVVAPIMRHSVNSDNSCEPPRANDYCHKPPALYRASSCPVVLSLVHAEPANFSSKSGKGQGKQGPKRANAKSTFKRVGRNRRTAAAAAVEPPPQPPQFVGPSTWTGHGDLTGSMLSYESSV